MEYTTSTKKIEFFMGFGIFGLVLLKFVFILLFYFILV